MKIKIHKTMILPVVFYGRKTYLERGENRRRSNKGLEKLA
jgi:hypothetical protein